MNDISKYRNGRPPGARNRFSGQFLADLAEAWAEHGKDALNIMAVEEPGKFVVACASLLPRDVLLTVEHEPSPFADMTPEQKRRAAEMIYKSLEMEAAKVIEAVPSEHRLMVPRGPNESNQALSGKSPVHGIFREAYGKFCAPC